MTLWTPSRGIRGIECCCEWTVEVPCPWKVCCAAWCQLPCHLHYPPAIQSFGVFDVFYNGLIKYRIMCHDAPHLTGPCLRRRHSNLYNLASAI
jgi:hypothetical protein